MAKTSFLVSFYPTTRLVLDVPDNKNVEDFIDYNLDMFSRIARTKMLKDIGDYLYGDNMEVHIDEECPAEENELCDLDPEEYGL